MDGTTIQAVTDALGDFRLEPVPAGRFFVHIDGRTVTEAEIDGVVEVTSFPDGPYFPVVGKAWESVPSQLETNIGNIYLPIIEADTLESVTEDDDKILTFSADFIEENPQFEGVQVTIPANSLLADDGTRGGRVGIAPVPPDRLPGPLPEGLQIQDVVTIQTDGATNFDEPAPICLPNLPDMETGVTLAPGEKSALFSFNHDTGRFEIVGSMTVSDDGKRVCSDPGVGVLAPGWHGQQQGSGASGGGGGDPGGDNNCTGDCCADCCNDAVECCEQGGGGSPPPPGSSAGNPILLFSGEKFEQVVDLRIKGRGMDFVWQRTYGSKVGPNTAQGNGWDFSYNLF